nr:TetR/AcrR family transcriptional regulator [Kibdelosporangium sp. MJ126-NF4]CEL14868.1 Transcriptional regulator, TetR family [Kibdelosporangium sp. MJ126-NF4]CTQ96501.1 Transcriptional regulator, TetR family [Kibdelosporangium sp. MJ126-NF4]
MWSKPLAKKRAKVLEAARALFNEQSTTEVGVDQIAEAARISPEELGHHFRDKQEIIRALFELYGRALDGRWHPGKDAAKNVAVMARNLTEMSSLRWDYRFFQREMVLLLRADPRLRTAYDAVSERRISEMRVFAQQLVLQDMLRVPRLPRTLDDLLMSVWLISEGWQAWLDVTGTPASPDDVGRLNDLLMVVIDPYLTDQGRDLFEKMVQ